MSDPGSIARVSGSVSEVDGALLGEPDAPVAVAGGIPAPELPREEPFAGGRVIEVVALFADAIVETRHFSPPARRDLRRRALTLLAAAAVAAGAALVLLVLAFARVRMLSLPVDVSFFALFVAGFAIFTWGMVRRFEARAPRDFTIGTAPGVLFAVPGDALPSARFPLLAADGDGHLLHLLPGMAGEVTIAGRASPLAEVAGAVASPSLAGARAIRFTDGMEARITLGAITFILRHTDGARRESTAAAPDPAHLMSQAGAFALFMIALSVLHAMPPPAHPGLDDLLARPRVTMIGASGYGRFGRPAMEGPAPRGAMGRAGHRRGSRPSPGAYAIAGPLTNPDPHLARARREAVEQAARSGVTALFDGRGPAIASAFGRRSALGSDGENALGGLRGDLIGDAWGAGSLGLVGIGEGGGGTGEGTVGLGSIGTIGRGDGGGTGSGYGRGTGGLTGRRAVGPDLTLFAPSVRGALDKELIRRVVRNHINEIRYCYEKELVRDPSLEGRVTVRFTIAASGTVVASTGIESEDSVDAPSQLGSSSVSGCIAGAARRWEFPAARGGGISVVTYPFGLHAAGQ